MPSDVRLRALCTLLWLVSACGSDPEKLGMAPPKFVRPAPALSTPKAPDDAGAAPSATVFEFTGDASTPCCHKTFSFPASGSGEVGVSVHGDGVQLENAGFALKKVSGVWQGTLCLPVDQTGIYYYELEFPAEGNDGGEPPGNGSFYAQRYNAAEPTVADSVWGTVNAFVPQKICK